jgi:hypothetical protein
MVNGADLPATALDCARAVRVMQRAIRDAAPTAFWLRAQLVSYIRLEDGSDHWHFVLREIDPPANRLPAELQCRVWRGLALQVFESLVLSADAPHGSSGCIASWRVRPRVTYAAGLIWEIHEVQDIVAPRGRKREPALESRFDLTAQVDVSEQLTETHAR